MDDAHRESIETSARFLYGLIHARYIVTSRGLQKMVSVVIRSKKARHTGLWARARRYRSLEVKEGTTHSAALCLFFLSLPRRTTKLNRVGT